MIGDLREEFQEALAGLVPGQISPVTKLGEEYVLLQLLAEQEAKIAQAEAIIAPSEDPGAELILSVFTGDRAIVEVVLNHGADVHAKDNSGFTALHTAAEWGHADIVRLLLARGAEVNERNSIGNTPLHLAANAGFVSVVELLLARGADLDVRQRTGFTPLHHAAMHGHKAVVELLIAKGADLNAKNEAGVTPLHMVAIGRTATAAREGQEFGKRAPPLGTDQEYLAAAELLIAHGADINANQEDGFTPLHTAVHHGNSPMVELLLAEEADVDARSNPLEIDPGRSQVDPGYFTPLHSAVLNGHAAVASLLLAGGGDVMAKDEAGATPLHWAALVGETAMVELLLTRGSEVDPRDISRQTPLHQAVIEGHTAVVELLLANGADVNAKSPAYGGSTPLAIAARLGHKDVADLLRGQGGRQ